MVICNMIILWYYENYKKLGGISDIDIYIQMIEIMLILFLRPKIGLGIYGYDSNAGWRMFERCVGNHHAGIYFDSVDSLTPLT